MTCLFLTNERGRFLPCGAATQDTHTKCRAQKTSTKRVTRCSSLVSLAGHTVVVGTWTWAPLAPRQPAARGSRRTRARQGRRRAGHQRYRACEEREQTPPLASRAT